MTETALPSQAGHWYDRQTGDPMYEIACTSKDGNRPTTLRDARKLDLVPSVTLVLNCMAKPGLESWKARQLLEASLTLPWHEGESVDDYAKRVTEDAKAQGIAAADRGTQLHAAIEKYIAGKWTDDVFPWKRHLHKLESTLGQHGIDLLSGKPEHSFSVGINGLFYGGKTDFHTRDEPVLIDFKSKDKIDDKKQLAFDDHAMQIAAYGYGLFSLISSGERPWKWQPFRGLNVFVGVDDYQVRVIEHSAEDLERGFQLFLCVLEFWHRKNRFGRFGNNGGKP